MRRRFASGAVGHRAHPLQCGLGNEIDADCIRRTGGITDETRRLRNKTDQEHRVQNDGRDQPEHEPAIVGPHHGADGLALQPRQLELALCDRLGHLFRSGAPHAVLVGGTAYRDRFARRGVAWQHNPTAIQSLRCLRRPSNRPARHPIFRAPVAGLWRHPTLSRAIGSQFDHIRVARRALDVAAVPV